MALRRIIQQSVQRCVLTETQTVSTVRFFSVTHLKNDSYKVVVVGGGSGGCATVAKFCRKLGKGQVAVIEPSEKHFYQPIWTLVGAGLKSFEQSERTMASVLPQNCTWIKDAAVKFDPENNSVTTASGKKIEYEYLVVAMGMQLNYGQVKGLTEALDSDPMVCTIYDSNYVKKGYPAMQNLQKGNAIFTIPNTPIKCTGAPQKIMYLAEEVFTKRQVRDKINVMFNSGLPTLFGVQKYAASLQEVVNRRNIQINQKHNLVEVKHDSKEAVFALLDNDKGETKTFKYDFLHATPPMSAPDALRSSPLVNQNGWVDVHKYTLQHNVYPNIFSLGDCSSLPNSKTAAAVAAQFGILSKNLSAVMNGKEPKAEYDGYASCPLVTGKNKCILAEFDYNAEPLETFPIDQSQERRSMYFMKSEVMPRLYWSGMLKGYWQGPSIMRKLLHLGFSR